MKNLLILVTLALGLAVMVGCGGDDDTTSPPPPVDNDQTVLDSGWAAFEVADYAQAESDFRELLGRDALVAEAHDGLGWTFSFQSQVDSSLVHFALAVDAGADTLAIADQTHAGLAIARHADEDYAGCLAAAAEVAAGWSFDHSGALDRNDITVLEAGAHYALGQFAEALAAVQELDASFDVDVGTVEGRAALAAKIESLFN
jgi:tetratricopeptide (TPR) repeat protein